MHRESKVWAPETFSSMNIVFYISITRCSSLCKYLFSHEFYQVSEKHLGNDEISSLISVALFPPGAIILNNNSEVLGIINS